MKRSAIRGQLPAFRFASCGLRENHSADRRLAGDQVVVAVAELEKLAEDSGHHGGYRIDPQDYAVWRSDGLVGDAEQSFLWSAEEESVRPDLGWHVCCGTGRE